MRRRGHQPLPALSPAIINRIARYLFNGFQNDEISLLTNLPERVIKDLRAGFGNTAALIACLNLKDKAIEKIKRGRGKLGGLIWFMERRYPRQFARPDVQLSLSTGTVTNNTLVVSADVAEGLLKRSKAALTEIDALIADKQPETASDAQ